MNKIPIFFTFDDNYVIPAAIAFFSLLNKAKNGIFYDMYVLHSNITLKNQKLLHDIVHKKNIKNNARLKFINTGDFLKKEWENNSFLQDNGRFTSDTIIRCFAAKFFPNYDKIIYSDVDIVVNDDISELWNMDLNEKYVLGVKNFLLIYDKTQLEHLSDTYYNKLKDTYIAGGLWVMNLLQIRKDNLEKKMIEIINNKSIIKKWNDQDIINMVSESKVGFIPLNYISCPFMLDYLLMQDFTSHYSKDELYDSILNPKIIHYAGEKPWKGNPRKSSIWWEYFYYLNLPKTQIFETKNNIKQNKIKSQIKNFYYGIMLALIQVPPISFINFHNFKRKIYDSIEKYKN